jgi:hypothetical protein
VKQLTTDLKATQNKIDKLELQLSQPSVVNNNNITINNNINIMYFNDNLEYYSELVKKMGEDNTCSYLLHRPHADQFDVLEKVYEDAGFFPINVHNGGLVIYKNNDEIIMDPTGSIIDKENKNKVTNALITAHEKYADPSVNMHKLITDFNKIPFKMKPLLKRWPKTKTQIIIPVPDNTIPKIKIPIIPKQR